MKIGEKIKAERKKQGLTQAALAQDSITRNMLSQIESGTAQPSLATLCDLSAALGLPAAYFLSEEETPFLYRKRERIEAIRAAVAAHDFARVVSLWDPGDGMDDELSYLFALSQTELGKLCVRKGNFVTAEAHFREAEAYCAVTRYPTDSLRAQICLHGAIARNVASPTLELDDEAYRALSRSVTDEELYHYVSEDLSYEYTQSLTEKHIRAKRLFKEGRYADAVSLLTEIEAEKASSGVSALLLFHVYTDLEFCYRELHDFEKAYRYSSKRIAQLSAFKS